MIMTNTNNISNYRFNAATLTKYMLIGAGIGLGLMALFLAGADEAKAEWGKLWMVKPLIIMPLGAAGGGACVYFLYLLFGYQGGWKKTATIVIGIIGFIIALFLSFVLGLDGTYWN
jgi:hypothetical protein